ncbi:MAG TPA: hypothetical protein VFD31_03410 [Thermoleophilaceae bacterium]|nr:hypothetical protein [Thermoleophilaceae bacterium]
MTYVNYSNRTRPSLPPVGQAGEVTVRLAEYSDAAALTRLAALDDALVPDGPVLVAEAGDQAVAALPLHGGHAIADPFRRTTAMVEMLDLRARQLRGSDERKAGLSERLRSAFRAPRIRPHAS